MTPRQVNMDSQPPPRPLRTSLVLLALGTVALGTAVVLLPKTRPQSSAETVVQQSPAAQQYATAPATTAASPLAIGTPPMRTDTPSGSGGGSNPQMTMEEGATGDAGATQTAPPAPRPQLANTEPNAPNTQAQGVAVPMANNGAAPTQATTATTTTSASAASSAIGGGPPDPTSDAGASSTDAAPSGLEGDAAAAQNATPPIFPMMPVYGAPPASTNSTGPITNGAAGSTAPLYSGTGGGGGGTVTNGAVVNPRPSIATTFMLTLSEGDDAERAWTSLSPILHPGDLVVARIGGDPSSPYATWGDRVRTDSPLVSYVIALPDAKGVQAMIARGLPSTLDGIGVATTDAIDVKALPSLATAVHAAGKKLFLSVSSAPTTIRLADLGARSDLVEVVLSSTDATTATAEASRAIALLRGTGNPTIFLRVPASVSGTSTSTYASAITANTNNVGVSFPYGTSASTLSDLRTSP